MNRGLTILAAAAVVVVALALGAWIGVAVARNDAPGDAAEVKTSVAREVTEIHHEPTVIERTYNRTMPTKETVREVTRWRTTTVPSTLPPTGGSPR